MAGKDRLTCDTENQDDRRDMNDRKRFSDEIVHPAIKSAVLERWRISQRKVGGGDGLFLPEASDAELESIWCGLTVEEKLQIRLKHVAAICGETIAQSVLDRVKTFPDRQRLLRSFFEHDLESVPAEILWDGLQEDAAPMFLVYKMLHEAFSKSPVFFRWFIENLMREQQDRFPLVFSRETLWSVVATHPDYDVPANLGAPAAIARMLECLNSKGVWSRSAEDIQREAHHISAMLKDQAEFVKGAEALRSLQLVRGSAFTYGNLMLLVPAELRQFADHVVELGRDGTVVEEAEIWQTIRRVLKREDAEGRHESIPIDLLYSSTDHEGYRVRVLARSKASRDQRARYCRQLIYTRYFMAYAFRGVKPEAHDVRLAFYLDPVSFFESSAAREVLFRESDILPRDAFWREVAANPGNLDLVGLVREKASMRLKAENLPKRIRDHFATTRKS